MIRVVRLFGVGLFVLLMLSAGLVAAGEPAKEEDPFDGPPVGTPKASPWKNAVDPREDACGIRVLSPVFDPEKAVVYAPGESPFVVIGEDIYDVVQEKVIGKAPRKKVHNTFGMEMRLALSPNGQLLAHEHEDGEGNYSVRIIDTQTGSVKHEFKSKEDPHGRTIHLSFTKNNHLAAVTQIKSISRVTMVNMESGKVLKTFDTERLEDVRITFSRNGQYMATVFGVANRLVVIDVVQGKPVAQMAFPASVAQTTSFTNIRALAFSADTSELAGLFTGVESHVVVWDAHGKIMAEYPLGITAMKTHSSLRFSPDGKVLLVNDDYLLDRKIKAVVLICASPHAHFGHRFLDSEHLLATRGDFSKGELVSVRIPRQGIDNAAASLSSGAAAWLKPGDSIRLEMQVGATKVDAKSVSQQLEKDIAERLAVGGLKVGDDSNLSLQVKYAESMGQKLRVIESNGLGRPGYDTGQRVQSTVGTLEAKLVVMSTGKVLWETKEEFGSPTYIEAAVVNDGVVRDKMFEMISHIIKRTSFPFYIAADPKAPSLPIIIGDMDAVGEDVSRREREKNLLKAASPGSPAPIRPSP